MHDGATSSSFLPTQQSFSVVQDNSLSSVTGLLKLTGLRKLDLARNCLTSLGQLSALHSLAHLSIEGNRLTSLAGTLRTSWNALFHF